MGEENWGRLYLPWLSRSGVAQGAGTGDENGFGDLRLTFGRTLYRATALPGEPSFGLALQTRLPSASRASLGTGYFEHVLRLDTHASLAEDTTVYMSFGRRLAPVPGSGGAGADYWTFYGDLSYAISPTWSGGVSIEAQDRVEDANRRVLEAGAFLDHTVNDSVSVGGFVLRGLTQESAGTTIGLRFLWRQPVGQ